MQYKVGDKVKVKSLEWYEQCKDSNGVVEDASTCITFEPEMAGFLGTTVTICEVGGSYYIEEDCRRWVWCDYMFEDSECVTSENTKKPDANIKYNRTIVGMDGVKTTVDVYRVLSAFAVIEPELQHSIKKMLCLGIRGKGDYLQDLDEAILSLQKMKQRKEQESV